MPKKDSGDLRAGEDRKLIPEGKYTAQCIKAKRGSVGQKTPKGSFALTPKVILKFKIVEGEHQGTELPMFINANYKFFNPGTLFYKSWVIASGRKPKRKNRMPLEVFKGHIFTVRVRTTRPLFGDGTETPVTLWYSTVAEIYEKQA